MTPPSYVNKIATNSLLFQFGEGYGSIVYIVYTIAVFTEIFLYCLGGTVVMEAVCIMQRHQLSKDSIASLLHLSLQSEELGDEAYLSNWCDHSIRIQKMVFLIILRCQRSINVKVPFFAPTFPTLTSVSTYSP